MGKGVLKLANITALFKCDIMFRASYMAVCSWCVGEGESVSICAHIALLPDVCFMRFKIDHNYDITPPVSHSP